MNYANLFGLELDDWKALASLLFSPALAMAAIYVLGVDLAKIPFISADISYRVPTNLVRAVAVCLSFSFGMTLAVWLTLRVYEPLPDLIAFSQQFFRELTAEESAWLRQAHNRGITGARISLLTYDGRSDARVFLNNVRVFGTHVDCLAQYQCRDDPKLTPSDLLDGARSLGVTLNPVYPLSQPRKLPLNIDLKSAWKQNRTNVIEIFTNNSGTGFCETAFAIELEVADGARLTHTFRMSSSNHDDARYVTITEYPHYRVCDNVHLVLKPLHSEPLTY